MTPPPSPPLRRHHHRRPPPPLHPLPLRVVGSAIVGAIALAAAAVFVFDAATPANARPLTERDRWSRVRFCVSVIEEKEEFEGECGCVHFFSVF